MTAIEELQNWATNGKDYYKGVTIYQQLGYSMVLKKMFAKGPSKYNTAKLSSELEKLVNKHFAIKAPVQKRTKIVQKQNPSVIVSPPTLAPRYTEPSFEGVDFDKLPEQLKYETMLRIKYFKEANAHHYRLDSLTDPGEIKQSIDLILSNFEKVDAYWVRLDYWQKNGIVLPTDVDKSTIKEITDPIEMIKRRNNLRSNITKGKKKVVVLKDTTKIANLNQKIAHWEIELADLDEKIKQHG